MNQRPSGRIGPRGRADEASAIAAGVWTIGVVHEYFSERPVRHGGCAPDLRSDWWRARRFRLGDVQVEVALCSITFRRFQAGALDAHRGGHGPGIRKRGAAAPSLPIHRRSTRPSRRRWRRGSGVRSRRCGRGSMALMPRSIGSLQGPSGCSAWTTRRRLFGGEVDVEAAFVLTEIRGPHAAVK